MAGLLGKGSKLEREDPAMPGTWAEIAHTKSIDGPSSTSDQVDATTHTSASGYREFIAGLKDGGEVSFDLNFVSGDSSFDTFNADFEAQVNRNWRIELPDTGTTHGTRIAFSGAVTGRSAGVPVDDVVTISATIKVSGAVTFTDPD